MLFVQLACLYNVTELLFRAPASLGIRFSGFCEVVLGEVRRVDYLYLYIAIFPIPSFVWIAKHASPLFGHPENCRHLRSPCFVMCPFMFILLVGGSDESCDCEETSTK